MRQSVCCLINGNMPAQYHHNSTVAHTQISIVSFHFGAASAEIAAELLTYRRIRGS